MPSARESVPMWGRIRLIRDARGEDKPLALGDVLSFDRQRVLATDEYAWCWALCWLLDSHPRWQEKFRSLSEHVGERRFNQRVRSEFSQEWPDLQAEWQAYVQTLDYGYDVQRMVMQHATSTAQPADGATVEIDAARGWQSSGWELQAGQS